MKRTALCFVAAAALATPVSGRAAVRIGAQNSEYDLSAGAVFDRVVLAVMEQYYDPDRADPREMLRRALAALEKAVAEVKVDYDDRADRATVYVLTERLDIPLRSVNAPWGLSRAMHGVFAFINKHLPRDDARDLREIEYAAVNGMLSALDPHSGAMVPKEWQELRMRLEGEFEGIGIRITTDRRPPCSGDLTVVEVFPKTPADLVGLRAGDKIVRIGSDSTVNITTDEAAERLRGAHGTKVKVQIRRASGQLVTLEIPRDTIAIESVRWKMLDGDVGYVYLSEFQQDSASEVAAALLALRKKGMRALVLDVRDNPGGSLDAASEIADLFLSTGTIVTTAGRHHGDREVRNAEQKGTEPAYPVVILANAYSASAAEVISGALRNHGKALIVGETTFGKGSVQSIVPLPGDGALRLTVAQYLTPGDISIQGVGIAPDVRLLPIFVDKKDMNLEMSGPMVSERDLESHLARPNELERTDRPGLAVAPLLVPTAERNADLAVFERCYDPDPDRLPFKARRELELARRIAAAAQGTTTGDLIATARRLLREDEVAADVAVATALAKVGIDWKTTATCTAVPSKVSPELSATAKLVGTSAPGQSLKLVANVKNGSASAVDRLRAVTKSDNPFLDDVELVFGHLAPGAQKKWEAVVELPPVLQGRVDPVEISFSAACGPVPAPVSIQASFAPPPRSVLSYSWLVEDMGNGNGFAEPGERLAVHIVLKNVGDAPTFEADVQLSGGPGIDVIQGHLPIGKLAPGASAEGVLRMQVSPGFEEDDSEMRLVVEEWIPGRFSTTRRLLERTFRLPIASGRPSPSMESGIVTVTGGARLPLFESASRDSRIAGWAEPGGVFPIDARLSEFSRLDLGSGRHAWIASSSLRAGGTGPRKFELVSATPPTVSVKGQVVSTVAADSFQIEGVATHPVGVRDLIVIVGDKKVAYLPNRNPRAPGRLEFSVAVPLSEGANEISLIARHDSDVWSALPVFVRRTGK